MSVRDLVSNYKDTPLDHIERLVPPWSDMELTECGRRTVDVASVISRSEAERAYRLLGRQRFAVAVCQTCTATMTRNQYPEDDADMQVALRHLNTYRKHPTIGDEVRALAALVDRHRDEFRLLIGSDEAEVISVNFGGNDSSQGHGGAL